MKKNTPTSDKEQAAKLQSFAAQGLTNHLLAEIAYALFVLAKKK